MSEPPIQEEDTQSGKPVNAPVGEENKIEQEVFGAQVAPAAQQPYYSYPGRVQPPQKRGGGAGCWLVGLITLMLVIGLVVVGLFLPPFNLGERILGSDFAMLDATNNATQTDDTTLKVIVSPDDAGSEFGVSLDSVDLNAFIANSATTDVVWTAQAGAAVPPYLAVQSNVYGIETTGTTPALTTLDVALPASASPDVLDMYGWYTDAGEWRFIPSQLNAAGSFTARVSDLPDGVALFQASPLDPIVMTTLTFGYSMNTEAQTIVSIVSPTGMQPSLPNTPQRTLVGNPAPGFDISAGYQVMPVIRNFADSRATDPDTVLGIIRNRELRTEHAGQLAAFASAGGYAGVVIDYRDLPPDARDNFSAFIRELGNAMHAGGLRLSVIVPPAQNVDGRWDTGAYNWRAIGQSADYVQIDFGLDPTAFAPGEDRLVEAMLRWAVGEVSRYKLVANLSALSARQVGNEFTPIGYDDALSAIGNVQIDVQESDAGTVEQGSELRISLDGFDAIPGVDTSVQSPFIEYLNESGTTASRMWLTTGESLRFRLDRLSPFGIAGVGFADLLDEGVADGVEESILAYKIQAPGQPMQTELQLNWRIEGANGLITEFTTDFTDELVVTLNAPDGNYAVNVEVVGGEASSSRGGAAVALFAPTATSTPIPTPTPTATPTATPTLEPIVPTIAATAGNPVPPVNSGPVVAPGSGSIVGGFEYGGHVTSAGSARAATAMRSAGMTWMKVQLPYRLGNGTGGAAQAINDARSQGFRILLGIVGSPSELAAGGGDYIRQYANFVGQVAALGPDAIEVWNEPNIDREWPTGQITGANYTALLRESYNAIKSSNGSVIVISAALAPTGAEAAFPGRVVNDDNFLRQMVDAGALSFMDCVGLHYNEGTVPPTQSSGDFRDNFYSRYLPSMLSVYNGITGSQRPICITELGYLSPEGYPALSPNWSWGQNTSVSEQAAWLAGAAAYASQQGVRLMIVWNVDFQNYNDNDPMAGFAIIRPDGSCPACNAMAGAR
ncbi:MAG: hypothetical protein RLP44_21245 [Aggregatilineales bacterium]